MRWKVIGLIVFAIIIAVFTLDNTTSVDVNFIFVTATTKLIFVILLSVLLGMILMAILWSLRAWKLRSQMVALKKQLAKAEDELKGLKQGETEKLGEKQVSAEGTHQGDNEQRADEDETEVRTASEQEDEKKDNDTSVLPNNQSLNKESSSDADFDNDNRP
ncbi:lipopolysaccharide assembly LapA domain-containing protein [Alicyclobacillus sp. SO9]|uniref:LapA family protein n=1 Tax=Alicyclobacillus sp. SO9 TaxID=2665646 RepID=UPI0018E7898F|nr:LapA family protein [Alicyclobacillus sp. SO9]QQE80280.1 LapA family protein [Alicyclobacillus sp. SO9]